MKINQKGSAKLVSIGIIAILLVVGGYFVYHANKKTGWPFQSVASTEKITQFDQTTKEDRKTYSNAGYGFEFQYPKSYETRVSDKNSVPNELLIVNLVGPMGIDQYFPRSYIGVSVWSNPKSLSLADWAKANLSFSNFTQDPESTLKNETLAGHKAIVYSWQGEDYAETALIENSQSIIMIDTTDTFAISQSDKNWDKDFKSVLSTIKFTQPTIKAETADWQTYEDGLYGFEVKYPTNLYPAKYHNDLFVLNSTSLPLELGGAVPDGVNGKDFVTQGYTIYIDHEDDINLKTYLRDFPSEVKTLDSINGRKVYQFFDPGEMKTPITFIETSPSSKMYLTVNYDFRCTDEKICKKEEVKKLFDQILYTFKFTK